MNKKIKVIELYQKLAKQENMPDKIKYNNDIYYLCIDSLENVFYYETNKGFQLMTIITSVQALNREVEILEDEEKIDIQELEDVNLFDNGQNFNDMPIIIKSYDDNFTNINNTINKLIQAVKRLDKKNNKE